LHNKPLGCRASGDEFDALVDFIETNFVVPLDSLPRTRVYNDSGFSHRRGGDLLLLRACDKVLTRLVHCSLSELESFWNKVPNLFWRSEEYKSLCLHCYDLETS